MTIRPSTRPFRTARRGFAGLLIAAVAVAGIGLQLLPSRAEEMRMVPVPLVDETPVGQGTEVAVFAGGCFWGVQGVFQHVTGVASAVAGYAGGEEATAHYAMVGRGTTGHAESVRVTYDPSQVTYGRLLRIYFSVAHDPTQRDRQGPDFGTQYRSAIFPRDAEQARIATAYIAQIDQAHVFGSPIATTIEPDRTFYPAEDYHQDFLTRNPTQSYIARYDLPKIEALKRLFPDAYRPDPVLVAMAGVAR